MRLLRAKAARKTLAYYRAAFKIDAPYTVLVDGTFVHHAICTVKTNLSSRMEKLLGRGVKYAVPAAVLDELRDLGEACEEALKFCTRYCEVLGTAKGLDAGDAVIALIGETNEKRFVAATNDKTLQARVRRVAGTPLVHFSGTIITLDAPSKASLRSAKRTERQKGHLDDDEAKLAQQIRGNKKAKRRKEANDAVVRDPSRGRAKKRAAAANPMSCKKPQKPRNPPAKKKKAAAGPS